MADMTDNARMSPIAVRRKSLGMTQEDLAEAAGISSRYVSVLEAGSSRPTIDVARDVAEALRCGTDELWPRRKR